MLAPTPFNVSVPEPVRRMPPLPLSTPPSSRLPPAATAIVQDPPSWMGPLYWFVPDVAELMITAARSSRLDVAVTW